MFSLRCYAFSKSHLKTTYQNMFQDSACICFSHLQRQKSRIQRKLFFQSFLQDPHEAYFVLLPGDESCPVRAKTHHSDFQSLVCSHPSRDRNQPSRPVSFGTLSTPHRHVEGTCVVGVDCIDTAVPFTSFVELSTVLVNCKGWNYHLYRFLQDELSTVRLVIENHRPCYSWVAHYEWALNKRSKGIVNRGFKSFIEILIFR